VKVDFRDSFAKDLKAVKIKGLLKKVQEVIETVEETDSVAKLSNLKKLKGGGNYFRIRIGDYRIGLALENDTVIFVRCLNRKDIYKQFP
jgi:mRNA interferase RelE/StbE